MSRPLHALLHHNKQHSSPSIYIQIKTKNYNSIAVGGVQDKRFWHVSTTQKYPRSCKHVRKNSLPLSLSRLRGRGGKNHQNICAVSTFHSEFRMVCVFAFVFVCVSVWVCVFLCVCVSVCWHHNQTQKHTTIRHKNTCVCVCVSVCVCVCVCADTTIIFKASYT